MIKVTLNIPRLLTHSNVFRPTDETLQLLESIGAIKLRYSMTADHESWILVGYKGKQQVSWIAEKIGRIGEAIKIAVFVPLNESKPLFLATLHGRVKCCQYLVSLTSRRGEHTLVVHHFTHNTSGSSLHSQHEWLISSSSILLA